MLLDTSIWGGCEMRQEKTRVFVVSQPVTQSRQSLGTILPGPFCAYHSLLRGFDKLSEAERITVL